MMLMSWRLLRVVKSFCGVDERFVRDHNEPSDELADDSRTKGKRWVYKARFVVPPPSDHLQPHATHITHHSAAQQPHKHTTCVVGGSLVLLDIQSGCIGSIQIVSSSV